MICSCGSQTGDRGHLGVREAVSGTAKRSRICGFLISHPIEWCLIGQWTSTDVMTFFALPLILCEILDICGRDDHFFALSLILCGKLYICGRDHLFFCSSLDFAWKFMLKNKGPRVVEKNLSVMESSRLLNLRVPSTCFENLRVRVGYWWLTSSRSTEYIFCS